MDKIWVEKMKNFDDLKFTEHPSTFGGEYSKMTFDNGNEIIIFGDKIRGYEVELLNNKGQQIQDIIKTTDINKINELMIQIQTIS